MSYGKFSASLLLLFISSSQLHAQWDQVQWIGNSGMQPRTQSSISGSCNPAAITVKDTNGRAIVGAALVMEDTGYPATTDALGFAEIPACIGNKIPSRLKISASGYKSANLMLVADYPSRFEVILEKNQPAHRSAGVTVDAAELAKEFQGNSLELQNQASKALARRDYESAGKLLHEALQITPSSPVVANYLGIIALHNKDFDSAESWFQKAVTAAPFQPTFLANIGLLRWLQQRPEESYEIMTEACSKGYESNIAHFILGAVGLDKGHNQEAIYHLSKISADEFPYRDLFLSMAFRNTGKTKAADQSYRKFLQRNPAPEMNSLLAR